MGLYLNWFKSYDKNTNISLSVFFEFWKKLINCVMFFFRFFHFCVFFASVITFEPIKIQTRSVPQNDGLNFSFGGKNTRSGRKTDI